VETLCEELSGVYDKNTIMSLYDEATAEPYSFMFIRLDAKTRRDMFWLRFEARLLPSDTTDKDDGDDGLGSVGHGPGGVQQVRQAGQAALGQPAPPQRPSGQRR